jgi:hypothetical protein
VWVRIPPSAPIVFNNLHGADVLRGKPNGVIVVGTFQFFQQISRELAFPTLASSRHPLKPHWSLAARYSVHYCARKMTHYFLTDWDVLWAAAGTPSCERHRARSSAEISGFSLYCGRRIASVAAG